LDTSKFNQIIVNCLYLVLCLDLFSKPVLTKGSQQLDNMLGITINTWPKAQNLKQYIVNLLSNINIQNIAPLYQKIDNNKIIQEHNKLFNTN